MAISDLTVLIDRTMNLALAGNRPELQILREQYRHAGVHARDFSAWGGYVDFDVPAKIQRIQQRSVVLGDVNLRLRGVDPEVAVILYAVDGALHFLEFSTSKDDWPADPKISSIGYFAFQANGPGGFDLVPTDVRDLNYVNRAFNS